MNKLKLTLIFASFVISGCHDSYRYTCQNPDNFNLAECQKPKCLFTQTCPEYLVAPIALEKKIEPEQPKPLVK